MIILITISIITNCFYYKLLFVKTESDILKKNGCLPDIILLFTKIGFNLIFSLDKNNEEDHWIIIFFLILISGTNSYFAIYFQNRINIILSLLNKILSLILFSSSFTLFFGKILKSSKFNGLIALFPILIVLISIYIIFYEKKNSNDFLINFNKINDSNEYLQYIYSFYFTFINKNNNRNNNIKFKVSFSTIEEKCIDKDCPLKKYLLDLKNLDKEYLLFKYCDKLFSYGMSKFYNNINFIVNYISFLIVELNNNKKALLLLDIIEENFSFYFHNYNIHVCRKLIENSNITKENNFLDEYQNNIKKFKELIKKTILLYYQFMLLLLECKIKNKSNFNLTNTIGTEIIVLKKAIDSNYQKNILVKTNNNQIIKLYSEFNEIILNSKGVYQILDYNDNIQNNEVDYTNINSQIYAEKDNDYLIISSDKKNFGEIVDCSINLSKVLGFQKNEIKGKKIDILIPPIFQENHNIVLKELSKKYNLDFFETLINRKKYRPNSIEKETYCLTKSKFLMPIRIKSFFSRTEENAFVYFAKVTPYIPLTNNFLTKHEIFNPYNKCCVLTDKNLLIKSFTSNCIELLNLNNEHVNSNHSIINFIQELQEDYLFTSNIDKTSFKDNNNENKQEKISRKENIILENDLKINENIYKNLLDKKYNRKCKISWQITEDNNNLISKSKVLKKNSKVPRKRSSSHNSTLLNINKNTNDKDKKLYCFMEIKKIIINNQLLGYYFLLTKLSNNQINNAKNVGSTNCTSEINYENTYLKINLNSERKLISNNSIEKSQLESSSCENEKMNLNNSNQKNTEITKYSSSVKNENELFSSINKNFIPKSHLNFIFNINNFSYELSKYMNSNRKLKEILKKEAISKIKKYNEKITKNNNISSNKEESDSESSGSNEDSESSISSELNSSSQSEDNINSNLNNFGYLKSSSLNNIEDKKLGKMSNNFFDKAKTIMKTKTRNSVAYNNNYLFKKNDKESGKNLSYNFYRVNLKKIHFLLYDFNKEMFVENKNENISKVEEVMKNNKILRIGKDNMYPSIEFNINKINIKDNNKNNNKSKNEKNNINTKNLEKNKEQSLEDKIKEEINKKDDEIPIKRLKKISFLFFSLIIIFCCLTLYFNLTYYSSIHKLIELHKNIIKLKYCRLMALYYIKELALLNFEAPTIVGGEYTLYPSNNITKYKQLLADKLMELFIENHEALKGFFSSTISLSKKSMKSLDELVFKIDFILRGEKSLYSDIYETLVQYNNAFYMMATASVNVNQGMPDNYNINHNGDQDFERSVKVLTNIYQYELNSLNKKIIRSSILLLILYLVILISIYCFLLYYFLASRKRKFDYMKIINGINEDFLKNRLIKCQNLINKLNNCKDSISNKKEDESNNELKSKIEDLNFNKKNNVNRGSSIIDKHESIFKNNMKFIVIFSIWLLIIFTYFIFIFYYIIKLGNKSIAMKEFFYRLQNFHLDIIDIFNSFRQYIFDEKPSSELNRPVLVSLNLALIDSYETITSDVDYIQNYIAQNIPVEGEILELFSRDLCSFYITDSFNSSQECMKKYEIIINNDFSLFVTYFIDQIRIIKNLITYLLSTNIYQGKLNEYLVFTWLNNPLIPKIEGPNQNTGYKFRLELFNDETIHNYLNTIFINIILPYLDTSRKVILKNLSIKGDEFYFISYAIAYIIALLIYFFSFWIPIIIKVNNNIFQTKNILSIIPTDIILNDVNFFSKY